ncbi:MULTISPECIES: thioredoxin family protein [unclassified Sphingopyxis]|uniref:thioredoxin family protein n=1 Tax=unclassified Sphingopyxis TaxID=2614943 RepID=UPI00285FFD29|nr:MULTISPECIES: thioredoxin family protein [unclassified Sphingopyxis]MDR7061974.1 peroxiredoxin [Sphingopyxis sp. BE235]MDR7182081.1 peroxiredoxin [Sphingopyxis sp. BE249]
MKYPVFSFAAASVLLLAGCGQQAEQKADQPAAKEAAANAGGQVAPAFELASADGKQVSLADFRGKTVVLEWTNEGCPYVKKHYSGAMQKLQKEAVADGVVWLTIVSSAPGEQGFVEGESAKNWGQRFNAGFTHLLLDPTGATGRAYGAKTTPDMRVIDGEGRIIYTGGIDDKPTNKVEDLAGARNFVRAALDDHAAGRPVTTAFAQPYGCAIKYADEAASTKT